jgi:redox-sensitive bicupin YhaK (pirin superfamily)
MTAGSGIVHSEMFPLLDRDGPNTLEMFQIWINLPAADKMVDAHFSMFWDRDIPRHGVTDDAGRTVEVTVIAGSLGAAAPPPPPPASWASRTEADVSIWHIVMDAGTSWTLPPAASADTVRTLYAFGGSGLQIAGEAIPGSTGAVVESTTDVELTSSGRVEILVLQGRPLGEPVVQYGPFVMNTKAEIQQAFDDYQRTQFGGWPWDRDDPVHGTDGQRFARRADGSIERALVA